MPRSRRRPIAEFTQNLMAGLQMGFQHADRREAIAARRDAIAAQNQKNAQQADYNRQKLGIEAKRSDAYSRGVDADVLLKTAKAGAVGKGKAGDAPGLSPAAQAYYDANGGMPPGSGEVTPPNVYNVAAPASEPDTSQPPASMSGDGGLTEGAGLSGARGGKIPKMARGGRARQPMTDTFNSGMGNAVNTMRMMDYMDRAQQRRAPPATPTVSPVTRTSSTQTYGEPAVPSAINTMGSVGTGQYGPGSGYGETPPPPVDTGAWGGPVGGFEGGSGMGYQRGGRVQRMQAGGRPAPSMADNPSSLGALGMALGSAWWNRIRPGQMPPPTAGTPGPGQPLPNRFTDDDRGPAYDWAERGPRQIKRTDRGYVPPRGPQQPSWIGEEARADETPTPSAPPDEFAMQVGPTGADVDPRTAGVSRAPAAPARNGGGGRGGPGPWKRLGDQTRTEAYDPVKDRMDPRNTGVVYEPGRAPPQVGGNVNPMVYASRGDQGIVLGMPGQNVYRGGGRVKFAGGGGVGDPASDALLQQTRERMPAQDFGSSNAATGSGGDSTGGVSGSGGIGGSASAGEGGSAAAGTSGGAADSGDGSGTYNRGGRVRFAGGGRLPVPFQRGITTMPPTGGRPPHGAQEPVDDGQAEADRLTELWREEAHAAAQTNQNAPSRSGEIPPYQQPGASMEQNAPFDRQRRTEIPPYERTPASSQMERYGRPVTDVPMAEPGDQAGGTPAAQTGPPRGQVPVPPLPERDPAWARDPTYPAPDEAAGSPRQTWTPDRMEGPDRPEQRAPVYPDPREAEGSPLQRWTPDRMDRPEGTDRGPQQSTFQGEEARADETRPRGRSGAAGATEPGVPPQGMPRRGNGANAPAGAGGPSAGQIEADRLTEEYNRPKPAAPGAPAAIQATPPMAQTVGEPMGGYGLAGPGHGISTNNAARDYLGGANTFANWALKDAGGANQQQAQAALFSGKGAATPHEIAATFLAVDPDGKMPLDKRMEAAAKTVHDYYMAKGDVKAASEAAFSVAQFGVGKSREHGSEALKLLQSGNEQGALRELMAGYSWLVDKGTAKVEGQNIIVTGDDGKVRATIPLQPGTVQNLAMGMMSGQLAWDALRRGGTPSPPSQAVNATYPAAGNQPPPAPPGRQPMDERGSAGPTVPISTGAQPSAAPAGPAQPPAAPALDTTPPQAKPAPAPPSAAPAAAPRPPATQPSQAPAAGGGQPPRMEDFRGNRTSAPPKQGSGSTTTPDKPPIIPYNPNVPGSTEEKKPDEKKPNNEATNPSDPEEKELKAHLDKNPFTPPPKVIRQHAQDDPDLQQANERLRQLEEDHMKRRHQAEYGKAVMGLTPKERKEIIPKKLKELDDQYREQRAEINKWRDKFADRAIRQQEQESNVVLKPRELSVGEDEKLKQAFNARTKTVDQALGRNGREDPELKKFRDRTVLRYKINDAEREPLYDVAAGIYATNKGMSPEQAVRHAIVATSILKEGIGYNYQKGENAAEFRPIGGNLARGVVLQARDGTFNVDANTYTRLLALRADNWQKSLDTKATEDAEKARLAEARGNLGARALQVLPPNLQGPAAAIGYATGAIK